MFVFWFFFCIEWNLKIIFAIRFKVISHVQLFSTLTSVPLCLTFDFLSPLSASLVEERVLQDISIERTFVAFLLCPYMRSSFCCFCLGKKCWLSLRFWFTMFFVPLKVMQIHLHFLLEFVHWWRLRQAWIFSFVSKLFLFLPLTEFFFIHIIKIICHFVSGNG